MQYTIIFIRTIFFYFFLIFIYRLMGKKELSNLSIIDFIIGLLIAELAAISIENYNDSILNTVLPILILLFIEITVSKLSLKYNKFRNFIDGKPSLLINKGKINYTEMKSQRYTLDNLITELRNNNIRNINEVEYAILENNGILNIYRYSNKDNIPFPLILDGVIQIDTLKYIHKNTEWVMKYLRNNNLNLKDIFYAYYKNNNIYIIKKDELL